MEVQTAQTSLPIYFNCPAPGTVDVGTSAMTLFIDSCTCTSEDEVPLKDQKELAQLKADFSQICKELKQYRTLLQVQYDINQCYRKEIEDLGTRLNDKCKEKIIAENISTCNCYKIKPRTAIDDVNPEEKPDHQLLSPPVPIPRNIFPKKINDTQSKEISSEINSVPSTTNISDE